MTKHASRILTLLFLCGGVSQLTCEQDAKFTLKQENSKQSVSTTEPGVYTLRQLYEAADDVAVVEISAGDTESYDSAVYKAKVLTRFKGDAKRNTIYIGPYIGTRLGSKYVVFLRGSSPISPLHEGNLGFGTVPFSKVFDEGYSSMEISYECLFSDKGTSQPCDYAIRVCTDYIKLPEPIEMSPEVTGYTAFGCRWVKRDSLIALVSAMKQ
jgi:hypothetical protein